MTQKDLFQEILDKKGPREYFNALERDWEYLWEDIDTQIADMLRPLRDAWEKDPDLVKKKIDLALKKFEEEMLKKWLPSTF